MGESPFRNLALVAIWSINAYGSGLERGSPVSRKVQLTNRARGGLWRGQNRKEWVQDTFEGKLLRM